jgi:lipid II:glycine glycyltransferase (peptidoglycan interpeptide bridge formation enzyme)
MNSCGTEYSVRIDDVDPASWERTLSSFDDATVYQTWSFEAVHSRAKSVSHCIVERGGRPAAAAQVRIARFPLIPFGVAQVFWGPMCRESGGPADVEGLAHLANVLKEEYGKRRGLLVRLLPHAYEDTPECDAVLQALESNGFVKSSRGRIYRTFRMNLSRSHDELRASLAQKWRNQLNRAERNDLEIEEGDDLGRFDLFADLYREMMARKKFDTDVDVEKFREMVRNRDEFAWLRVFICRSGGVASAAVVVSAVGDTGIYLLGATNSEGMKSKSSYLLHWRVISWLKERGCRWYDLGGINPQSNPGVFHFKKGFSGDDVRQMGRFEFSPSAPHRALVHIEDSLRNWRRLLRSRARNHA